nr:ABC transporter substrate-binding protein [Sinorhizobium meliloti]
MMINKKASALLGMAMALIVAVTPALSRDLTITAWGGTSQEAQRKIFFEPFGQQKGIKVLDDSWNGGIGVVEAKVKTGDPNWDVLQVEADELAVGCADGLYETLDWSKIGNKEDWTEAAVSDCGVGANLWSTALTYDSAKFPQSAPSSWADFWDVQKFVGKRGMRKGPKMMLEFALMADGVKPTEVYDVLRAPGGIDRAFAKLDQLKPNIVWFESSAQSVQLVASGEVAMSVGFDQRITVFNKNENRKLKVVWPGSIYAIDSWVVLKGAANKEAGMEFIAFASDPKRMAELPLLTPVGLPNKVAAAQLPRDLAVTLPSSAENMKDAISIDADFWLDNIQTLTARFNTWLAQ